MRNFIFICICFCFTQVQSQSVQFATEMNLAVKSFDLAQSAKELKRLKKFK